MEDVFVALAMIIIFGMIIIVQALFMRKINTKLNKILKQTTYHHETSK